MLSQIPPQRLILYILILGIFPILGVAFSYWSEQNQIDELEMREQDVGEKALLQEKKQASNHAVRNYYKEADRFYIDKHLESLVFLEPEIEGLKKIMNNKNFADDEALKKRLDFLTTQNRLSFVEGNVVTYPYFQETTETMAHPVEVNADDLKKLLTAVEGIEMTPYVPSPNQPQFIILDFKLDKKQASEDNDVFTVNMKLLKREYM